MPFLTMGAGARALAMGEAATATTEDATALFWNPASLLSVKSQSASFMHAAAIENSFYDHVAYARRQATSAWGASLQYFSPGPVDKTDITGEKTGSLNPNDLALTGGYARSIDGYGVGGSVKYVQSTLIDTARAFALDGGAMTPPFFGQKVRAGIALTNLGTKIKYDQESESLPMTIRGGFDLRPWKGWTGALDLVAPKGEDLHFALGGEYRLSVIEEVSLALRGGYSTRDSGGSEGLSAGIGFGWNRLNVDYAFVSHGDLDPSQVLSVGYNF